MNFDLGLQGPAKDFRDELLNLQLLIQDKSKQVGFCPPARSAFLLSLTAGVFEESDFGCDGLHSLTDRRSEEEDDIDGLCVHLEAFCSCRLHTFVSWLRSQDFMPFP